ncbi:MAG: hypothetical protein AABW73_00025 [Nanoarchaeota archaeon]
MVSEKQNRAFRTFIGLSILVIFILLVNMNYPSNESNVKLSPENTQTTSYEEFDKLLSENPYLSIVIINNDGLIRTFDTTTIWGHDNLVEYTQLLQEEQKTYQVTTNFNMINEQIYQVNNLFLGASKWIRGNVCSGGEKSDSGSLAAGSSCSNNPECPNGQYCYTTGFFPLDKYEEGAPCYCYKKVSIGPVDA